MSSFEMYLLDTNVISETRLPNSGNRRALSWLDARNPSDLYLSTVTEYELELGVQLKEHRHGDSAYRYREWLEGIREAFEGRILPITAETSRLCASINVPDRRPFADSLIAATALQHGLTVATRNERDFAIPGLGVVNPFR